MDTIDSIKGKGVFANPKIDIAFKRCLGTPQYKDATIGLLNAFIPGRKIIDVKFDNVEFPRETEEKKTIYIDIICTDDMGRHFIVEMQRSGQPFFMQRMSFYASRVITTLDVDKGDMAYMVKPCYVIAFLDFDMAESIGMPEMKDKQSLHFVTSYVDGDTVVQHQGSPEFYYFDLTKFRKTVAESENEKEIWLSLLNESQDMLDVPQSLTDNKSFAAFFEGLRHVNFTKEDTLEYFKHMTDEMCWQAALKFREEKGEKTGLEKGRQEGEKTGLEKGEQIGRIKMAKALKEKGYPVSDIAEVSGLSIEEIQNL